MAANIMSAETRQEELEKLRKHILACPNVAPNSFVTQALLRRVGGGATLQRGTRRNSISLQSSKKPNRIRKSKKPTITAAKPPPVALWVRIIRSILMDIPLALLFISCLLTKGVEWYYSNYISPMIEAVRWIDSDRLFYEYTYYSRTCDGSDLSTQSLSDVILAPDLSGKDAVDSIMRHGMGIFPKILSDETSDALRNHILKRNDELTEEESIPLDGPQGRWSFGIRKFVHFRWFIVLII